MKQLVQQYGGALLAIVIAIAVITILVKLPNRIGDFVREIITVNSPETMDRNAFLEYMSK